jgi:hypothetical protein
MLLSLHIKNTENVPLGILSAERIGTTRGNACHTTSIKQKWKENWVVHAEVLWAVTACCVAVGYLHFRGPHCPHLHFTLKIKTPLSSETSVSYGNTTRCHNPEDHDLNLHWHENYKSREKNGFVYLHPLPNPNHFTLKMEAVWPSETSVSYRNKHGVTEHNTYISIFTAVKTANLTMLSYFIGWNIVLSYFNLAT